MSVRKVKNGWQAYRRDQWGIRRRKIFPTERKALDYEEKIKRIRLKKGVPKLAERVLTVGQFFSKEIATRENLVRKGKNKIGTLLKLKSVKKGMPDWLTRIPLPKLSPRQCRRYLKYLLPDCRSSKKRPAREDRGRQVALDARCADTAANYFRIFTAHLERAKKSNYCPTNPARGIKPSKMQLPKRKPIRALGEVQLGMLLYLASTVLPVKHYVLLCLLALTGMRVGEARALRWGHVELEEKGGSRIHITQTEVAGTFNDPKSGETRIVDVSGELEGILRAWRATMPSDPSAWVFPANPKRRGRRPRRSSVGQIFPSRPLSYGSIRKAWETLLAKDKDSLTDNRTLTLHSLRHTFATLLINEGEDIAYVSKQLGHASIAETQQTYAQHIDPESLQALAELDAELTLPDVPDPSQTVLPLIVKQRKRAWRRQHFQKRARPKNQQFSLTRIDDCQANLPMDWTDVIGPPA